MTDQKILELAVQEETFVGSLPHVCMVLREEIIRLRRRCDRALALTDTGSERFKQAFLPRDAVHGWRVVEKIREVLLDG